MSISPDCQPFAPVLRPLERAGVVPAVGRRLGDGRAGAVAGFVDSIRREVGAYAQSANPEVLPALGTHVDAHLEAVCRLLAGDLTGSLDFIRGHAARAAEQKFPLDALLQTYRALHRGLSTWIRDAAIEVAPAEAQLRRVVAAVTEFTIEYTGAAGTLATTAYVNQTRRIAEAEGDRRSALLNTLLDGYDESDQRAARLLRRSGYLEQRQSYCVALARSVNPTEMENTARAQRMADAVGQALDELPVRVIIGVRDQLVVAVISATRRLSGWTAPQSLLADRVYPVLRKVGPAALIGLSNDAPSTSHIPRALGEARFALDQASVAERVLRASDIPFRRMLIATARDEMQSALPPWTDPFIAADRRARGNLSATLRAYADCDMNVQGTAKSLGIHPNTIYSRLQKIADTTGLNALSYHALTELLLAIDVGGSA